MNKDFLVNKANNLVTARYDLSLEEQRVILTLSSLVQPQDTEFKPYEFKIIDFMELLGIKDKSKYTRIPKITKSLMQKILEIKENDELIQVAWLSSATYKEGTGTVILEFSPRLKPYMLQLNKLYTSYKLKNILELKGKYSIRIYEILKANEFKGGVEISVDDLKKILKVNAPSYDIYQNFKKRVLERAEKEINALTDLKFEFKEIKTGRKVTSIKFFIKPNKKIEDNEIALGKVEEDPETLNLIKQVQKIFTKHKVTEHEAKCMLKDSNNNLELIDKCYEYALSKNINENFVGYMRAIIKDFHEPQKNIKIKTSTFNDYEQRVYDYEQLERKLLGWDK